MKATERIIFAFIALLVAGSLIAATPIKDLIFQGNADAGGFQISNLGSPTSSSNAATVGYVTNALAAMQPLDADLSSIAGLTTTSYGRGFLSLADAAAARTAVGLGNVDNTADSEKNVNTAISASGPSDTTNFGGMNLASLFDGSGGYVANAQNASSANSANSATSALDATYDNVGNLLSSLFDGTGGNVATAFQAQQANSATTALSADYASSAGYTETANATSNVWDGSSATPTENLFNGSAGNVALAQNANSATSAVDATYDNVGNLLSSLFDGTGGHVALASNANLAVALQDTASAPAANAAGVAGQMIFTDTYTYRCFGNGDWRRTPVTYTGGY